MRTAAAALAVLVVLATPRPAAAWSMEVHKFITARAIQLLPAEIRPYFNKYEASIVEHAIDPDLWRTAGFVEETPHHFLDMDSYGASPFKDLPHVYDDAVKRYGLAFVQKNGTLPWRTEEIYRKLVDAFTQKGLYSRDNIRFFASVLSHYTADAHVPFHATANYDGQATGQSGIHARFETELFERYDGQVHVATHPRAPIANPRDFIFTTLADSFALVQPILDADKAAATGRDEYDEGYFSIFFGKTQPILERRLSDSIDGVAAMITAAWVEAGRPAVPLDAPRTPRKIRRQ